jgi:hypothetical protein
MGAGDLGGEVVDRGADKGEMMSGWWYDVWS